MTSALSISTILWYATTGVPFNSTLLCRHLRTGALRLNMLNGWIGRWMRSVEWSHREWNATDRLNGWIGCWMTNASGDCGVEYSNRSVEWLDWELNDQCQRWRRCWIHRIGKLNCQHEGSERVGDRMRLFRSRAYRKREVELNGTPLAAYHSIVLRLTNPNN